jgi:alkylation response protein AidB-like acyl-CoA dehydrogenase
LAKPLLDGSLAVGTETEAAFRARAVAFLDANAQRRRPADTTGGAGGDRVGLFRERTMDEDRRELAVARAWRSRCYDDGFIWVSGPPEYGGRGLDPRFDRLWGSLEAGYDVPSSAVFGIGLGMVAPTILAHGTDTAKARYLRAIWRGDAVACQLFSEPGAGSDLASVSTHAVPADGHWIATGQKVWTSAAHLSDVGLLLTRTSQDPERRHRGLTMFLVDMHAPGVEVRPLRQMTGGASFNEVFLDEVRIPDDLRLGAVGEGWRVAQTTLMNERASVSGGGPASPRFGATTRLFELARALGRNDDPLVRQQLAQLWIRTSIARYSRARAAAGLRAGQTPGPEHAISKLFTVGTQALMVELAGALNGPLLTADSDRWGTYAWAEFVLGTPGARLGGGSDEIMRNILAERVLGLPK